MFVVRVVDTDELNVPLALPDAVLLDVMVAVGNGLCVMVVMECDDE